MSLDTEYQPQTIITVHKDIRFDPKLSWGEKFFYAELVSMYNNAPDNKLPFSSRRMSSFFGVSHQTILNWVKKLVELDMVEVLIGYNEDNRYFIKLKKYQSVA